MFKKLRIKFIVLNMATVAVVLGVVLTGICVVNYQQSVSQVTAVLDGAISQAAEAATHTAKDGKAPDGAADAGVAEVGADGAAAADAGAGVEASAVADIGADAASTDGEAASPDGAAASESDSADDGVGAPPVIGGHDKKYEQIIPAAVYTVQSDGTAQAASAYNTASISSEVLESATDALASLDEGSGTLSNLGLFYQKRTVNGTMYVAFADVSAASGWQSLALTLAVAGIAALGVFFVISLFFSRWALRPVAQAWERQRRFVADASHDLKTPLTVILANTSILMEHPERSVASQSQWIESTQHEATAMQGLVGDLLLLAKMDEEQDTRGLERAGVGAGGLGGAGAATGATPAPVDFADLVEGELLQFESVAFERSIALEADIAPSIAVMGAEPRLRRLASTLLDNACKYAEDGGRVSVALAADGKAARLSVHNTGPAIAPEDLPHVFDRFYRADKARTSGTGGHGLGLAIARAIAEEHGGTLTVASTEAEGTTFTATLPMK